MSTLLEKEELLIRYLLGKASEAEQEEIEAKFFADNDLFEQMIVVENDLIDSFIRGSLTADEEELFKTQYFTTETRSNRVNVSKAFISVATESRLKDASEKKLETEKRPWIAWLQQPIGGFAWARVGMAVLFIAVSLFGGYFLWRYGKQENEIVKTPVPSPMPLSSPTPVLVKTNPTPPQPSNEENKNTPEKGTPKQEPLKSVIATLVLSGGAVRGGSSSSMLTINDSTSRVNIKIKINNTPYASYQGIIKRVAGEEIWRGNLSRKGSSVEVTISAQKFSQGDYIITVEGTTTEGTTENVKSSYFKVKISK